MLRIVFAPALLAFTMPAYAQGGSLDADVLERLNSAVAEAQKDDTVSPAVVTDEIPQWGIAVRDDGGRIVDVFGQVPYEIEVDGAVAVPGYVAPEGSSLEVVPTQEWQRAASMITMAGSESDEEGYRPLNSLPRATGAATDFLAEEYCGKRNRPSAVTLSLVAGVSGGVFFATASTEAGSEVSWEFREDVCPRYGLEGDGIPFR